MTKPNPLLFSLQDLVSQLALIDRNHYISRDERRENDIEHSFSVALLCWYVFTQCKPGLDLLKVLQYAMVHDFVERYAGDTNTFADKAARQKKVEDEAKSLERLAEEFALFPDMITMMRQYEERKDEESLFVWTVDKMQALILGDQDNWRPFAEINVSFESFMKKHIETLKKGSSYCEQIHKGLFEYCQTTYYDRPKS